MSRFSITVTLNLFSYSKAMFLQHWAFYNPEKEHFVKNVIGRLV